MSELARDGMLEALDQIDTGCSLVVAGCQKYYEHFGKESRAKWPNVGDQHVLDDGLGQRRLLRVLRHRLARVLGLEPEPGEGDLDLVESLRQQVTQHIR